MKAKFTLAAMLLIMILCSFTMIFSPAAISETNETLRFDSSILIDIYNENSFSSIMEYLDAIEEKYGSFFTWDYREKPELSVALNAIISSDDVDSDWPEVSAILNTGFSIPSECCISIDKAIAISKNALLRIYTFNDNWSSYVGCYASFIDDDTSHLWRIIFWPLPGVSGKVDFSGVVIIYADSGEIASITKNDGSSFETSIPYFDRM